VELALVYRSIVHCTLRERTQINDFYVAQDAFERLDIYPYTVLSRYPIKLALKRLLEGLLDLGLVNPFLAN